MFLRVVSTLLPVVYAVLFAVPAAACGPQSDCVLGDRHYRIAMPENHDGATAVPVIIFAHGYQGTARGVMRNGSLRGLADDLGAALIAVKSKGPGWNLPNGPRTMNSDGSAEFDYFDAVMADASARFALDTDRIMVTGFSAGGMMVWNLACARPQAYAGFAPIAGTYWLEPPAACAMPVASIIHIHGDSDRTVPLTGRVIGPTKQGEVGEALEMYTSFGGFEVAQPAQYKGLSCQESQNAGGEVLHFCLFKGGHSFRTQHVRHAWEQLVKAGRLSAE